jgi:hypothetical protein
MYIEIYDTDYNFSCCFIWSMVYNIGRDTNEKSVCGKEILRRKFGLTREWSDPTCRNLP